VLNDSDPWAGAVATDHDSVNPAVGSVIAKNVSIPIPDVFSHTVSVWEATLENETCAWLLLIPATVNSAISSIAYLIGLARRRIKVFLILHIILNVLNSFK
jgi:hypothetical protein